MSEIVIEVNELSKQYHLNSEKGSRKVTTALKSISFEINKGERWGIIGKNGSGKSTLLKMLSGIVKPSSGSVTLVGSVAHILSVGDNFIPDLTGRENVEIFFRLNGFSAQEATEAFNRAAEFAEIGDYIYSPVKTYSDGMYLRVAFSACLQLSANILLVDEVFNAGDAAFREKLKLHYNDKYTSAETMVMVSHNPEEIITYCTHCLWLENGAIKLVGSAKDVETAYYYAMFKEKREEAYKRPLVQNADNMGTPFVPVENELLKVSDFSIEAPEGAASITYESGILFNIDIEKKQEHLVLHPAIHIYDYLMNMILTMIPQANSMSDSNMKTHENTTGKMRFTTKLQPYILTFGNYYAEIIFAKNSSPDRDFLVEAIKAPGKIHFEVRQGKIYDYAGGTNNISIKPQCNWEITIPDNIKEARTN